MLRVSIDVVGTFGSIVFAFAAAGCEPHAYSAEGVSAPEPAASSPATEPNSKTVSLSAAGQKVVVVMSPPVGCQVIGDVFGQFAADDPGQAALGARIQLRNNTASVDANTVVLQTNNQSRDEKFNPFVGGTMPGKHQVVLGGVAYRCATKTPPPPASTSEPTPSQSL